MGKKIRTEEVDHLFEAILCLKDKEECYTFFEDVCTINELLSLSQRFEVAKMLTDKRTYLDISEKTGASTATISRVNRSLNYGNDGYEMVFARMNEKEANSEKYNKLKTAVSRSKNLFTAVFVVYRELFFAVSCHKFIYCIGDVFYSLLCLFVITYIVIKDTEHIGSVTI